jgi:hypothetical protein
MRTATTFASAACFQRPTGLLSASSFARSKSSPRRAAFPAHALDSLAACTSRFCWPVSCSPSPPPLSRAPRTHCVHSSPDMLRSTGRPSPCPSAVPSRAALTVARRARRSPFCPSNARSSTSRRQGPRRTSPRSVRSSRARTRCSAVVRAGQTFVRRPRNRQPPFCAGTRPSSAWT